MTGFLVDSVEACAARALELLRDPGARQARSGRAGKEHVRQHFLMPRYLRDYLRIFSELLDEAEAPRRCEPRADAARSSWSPTAGP